MNDILHGIIFANVLIILFNMIGMGFDLKPPSLSTFITIWLSLVVLFCLPALI